jgi:quercetin dioxygenase-like cupin family protein
MLHFRMAHSPTRRTFLRSTPLAAAVLPFANATLFAQAPVAVAPPQPFKFFAADKLTADTAALHTTPGNNNLFDNPTLPFTVVLTVEEKKSAAQFEWHEGRDHVLQILEGTTVYEIGGIPQTPHNTKPGEWLAPSSTGATRIVLNRGDLLILPRGTPHKRSTETSVTFYLISTTGVLLA